jgi:O-antigen/teichoic acid export membrane protein
VAIEKSMNFLLFCGIPMATVLIVAAPNIIGFLYHRAEFTNSVAALQALAPGIVFLYINTVLSTTLISTKNEKKITRMAAAALVFNLSLNFILIPRLQHVGAAIVTSLTELLLLCIAVVLIPKDLFPFGSLKVGAKALAASLAMALVILPLSIFHIFVILPVAMLVYLVVALVLRTIPGEDITALSTAIRHKAHSAPPDAPAQQQGAEPQLEAQEEDAEITEKLVRVNMNAALNSALEESDITEKLVRVKINLISPEVVP